MEAVNEDRTKDDLAAIYGRRFSGLEDYRRKVWSILMSDFFHRFVPGNGAVLDLGCGYGEFINQVKARSRYAIDLNPESMRIASRRARRT
ncbi:MAG TPA: class I SAM-dependent methyltransferase [Blastocatellia bacterium]|nr:class I SAM-dependent methyltransferase [Blastocatellia bacterium]